MLNTTDEVRVRRMADEQLEITNLENETFHRGYAIWLKDVEVETGDVYGFLVPGKELVEGTAERGVEFHSFGRTQPDGVSGKYAEITVDEIKLYPYKKRS